MKIYRPTKTNRITQVFGENKPCVLTDSAGKAVRPFIVKNFVNDICVTGYTKFYPAIGMKGHNGVDLASYIGEPVYFNVDAPVEWEASTEIDRDGGIGVNVRSKQPVPLASLPPEATGSMNLAQRQYAKLGGKVYVMFKFWHLSRVNVYDKQPVKLGQVIGFAGTTGASSGAHLHLGWKISDETSWFTLDGDNGYNGGLDFAPYFENIFVLDKIQGTELTKEQETYFVKAIALLTKQVAELVAAFSKIIKEKK